MTISRISHFLITTPPAFARVPLPLQLVGYLLVLLGVGVLLTSKLPGRNSLGSWLIGDGFLFFLYIGLRYQNVSGITWPLWWILIGLAQLAWGILLIRSIFAVMKDKRSPEVRAAIQGYHQYLPRRRKTRRR